MIFGTQVKYMKFFSYFFANNVFEYAILVWSFLSAMYFIIKPSDKPDVIKKKIFNYLKIFLIGHQRN